MRSLQLLGAVLTLAFSAAADRNKEAIGDALTPYLTRARTVLEIGSGTGQHAVYLAGRYTDLIWQPTDREENVIAINARVVQSNLPNINQTIVLDVADAGTVDTTYNFVFSANTAHIMSIVEVKAMFRVVAGLLRGNGYFALYGPFKYRGQHTSPGNENFDAMLQQQAAHMGIRDKADLDAMAFEYGLDFADDLAMPANNRILLWRR
ncbi:MAG: DUF938 domain-containing protein [Pseudomonadota bacterium]